MREGTAIGGAAKPVIRCNAKAVSRTFPLSPSTEIKPLSTTCAIWKNCKGDAEIVSPHTYTSSGEFYRFAAGRSAVWILFALGGGPENENRRPDGRLIALFGTMLRGANVLRLPAFGTLGHVELHGLTFLQAAEAAGLDG